MSWTYLANDESGLRLHGGSCTVGSRGHCRFDPNELASVGIGDFASVVFDAANGRIGLCKPEQGRHQIKVSRTAGERAVRIMLDRAIRAAGLNLTDCLGRRPTRVENGILIVELSSSVAREPSATVAMAG